MKTFIFTILIAMGSSLAGYADDGKVVTVNGQKCANKEELKAYLEKVYSDDRIFILEDENAILASYEWVEEACSELGIDLKK